MAFSRRYWLVLALCLALQGLGQVRADLVVLHTNDVHCGVENQLGYAQLAQYKKDLMKNPDDTVQLVDAGDAIQGEPLGSLTRGQAVIDGHSHEQYERLVKNRKGQPVLIAQTGTKFQSVGKLVIDDYGHVRGELVTKLDGADAATEAVVQREMAVVREQLQQPVTTLPVDFVTDIEGQRRVRNGETNLADLAVDAIRYRLHTDVALLNGGSFRAPLSAGIVTYESLYRVFPFSNQLVVCSVTGQQLLDALEMGASRYPQEFGGFLQVSGLTYRINPAIPSSVVLDDKGRFVKVAGPRRVKDVKVNGKAIEADEDYRVGGTAYVLRNGGDGQTSLQGGILLEDTGLSDVEALAEYLSHKGDTLAADYGNPAGQGRIIVGP